MESGIAGDVCGEILRNLCEDLAWDYAVFWKIRPQIPMLLSWEDGYCNHPRPELLPEFAVDATYIDGEADEHSLLDDASGYLLGPIVSDMSSLCYNVGEGLVGEVAETGIYCWLSCDEIPFRINSETPLIPQEWLPQLLAGIKTVLLVPVFPHGVLQLGSLNLVAKDMAVVARIAERFICLHNVLSQSQTYLEPKDVQDLLLLPIGYCLSDDTDDMLSVIEKNLVCTADLTEEESLLNFDERSAIFTPLEEKWSAPVDNNLEGGGLFSLEEANTFAERYPGGFYDTAADYSASRDLIALTYVEKVLNDIEDDILGNVLNFSMDCDLEEIFVSNTLTQENGAFYNKDEDNSPVEADSGDLTSNSGNSPTEVGNRDSSMETVENSRKRKYEPEETSDVEREDSVERSVITTAFSARPQDSPRDCLTLLCNLQGKRNRVNENDWVAKVSSNEFDRKKQEQTKRMAGCKRKVRPVDNRRPRPRPRDRQQIQDRIKELRELIPDGSKCSIDALLAQTVRHMLFLRSVTSRAEKLRKCTHPEESGQSNRRDSEVPAKHQSGSTGALEIAREQQVCPIVMEDLEYPGLMLIEMLCNEHGLFLEITEVLRRLELNIIRGSTEARRNDTWASFVVEASKGFQRIDIFWPLMLLLQRTRNPFSSSSSTVA